MWMPAFDLAADGKAEPNSISNAHWVLVLRSEFAEALKRSGWMSRAAT